MNRVWNYLATCATIACCTLFAANNTLAYTTVGNGWPQPNGRGSPITLTYSYQNVFDGSLLMPNGQPLPNLLIRDSIEEALGLWSQVVPLHFVEVEDDGISYPTSTKYGTIRFRHVFINGPDPAPPAQPTTKAQAYYPGGGRSSGDVEYDHGDPWQEMGTLPIPDILGATVHELGHSLGLGHSDLDDANMYWIFNRSSGLGTAALHQDDITGIQTLYGAGVGSVTPLLGTWPDRGIDATTILCNSYEFSNVPTGRWVDSPLGPEISFTANEGTLFSGITGLPTGFGDLFTVSVGGTVVGSFTPEQNVSFQSFPGGGVSGFEIAGANANTLALLESAPGFPLELAFTTPTGSFSATAVPEPATLLLLLLATLALSKTRRRHT